MKRIIFGIGILIYSVILSANEINNLQQKTNVILVIKVKSLEEMVDKLKIKIDSLEGNITLINKKIFSEGMPIKQNDLIATKTNSILLKPENQHVTESKEIKIANFKELYRIVKTSHGYKDRTGNNFSKKEFIEGSYVIIHKDMFFPDRSKTYTGNWIDSSNIKSIKKSDFEGKGYFCRVDTYMANARVKPTFYSEIESVLRKDDILYIIGTKRAKNGGIWKNIQNNGFINNRIIKKIKVY